MHMDDLIKRLVEEKLAPSSFELINESHKHAGHAGDDGSGQTHYKLKVASKSFEGLSRIERQRLVLSLLSEAFDKGLHAISLELSTPSS